MHMRVTANAAAVLAILWTGFFFLGQALIDDAAKRHLAGFPNGAQIHYYVAGPAYVAMAVLASAWVFSIFPRWSWMLLILDLAALFALLPYVFFYTGGI